jgi:SH3 domain-containing protein
MSARFLFAACLAVLSCLARAEEQAFTGRATEMKERAMADSATLASLAENTPVKVLARGGGWAHVEAGGKSGWVRVFHLRFPAVVETSTSSAGGLSSLGSALGFARPRTQQANLATTGVRGLTEEDLKNASPDPAALRRLQSWRADRGGAERFAREARLARVAIEVPEEARR